jgi:hypothetical protein
MSLKVKESAGQTRRPVAQPQNGAQTWRERERRESGIWGFIVTATVPAITTTTATVKTRRFGMFQ